MEERPPRVSKEGPTKRKKRSNSRYAVDDDDDDDGGAGGGEMIECSGKYCRSCTAGLIADCVALCCCPCAVLNILAFAFVKIPYMVGRRCLGVGKKEQMKRKCQKVIEKVEFEGGGGDGDHDFVVLERNINNGASFVEDEEGFDAEKIWLELYQLGHLDFGRVSFTGIDQSFSLGKGS